MWDSRVEPGAGRRSARRMGAVLCSAVLGLLVLGGCKHTGNFEWADDLKSPPQPSGYVIHSGDTLSVRVWGQDGMSARARVRDDGKISLPFLHDVEVVGFTPPVLAQQLQTRLKDFLANPVVTIALEEQRPFTISVLGEVARQGPAQLDPNSAGVLSAIAAAGGLTPFADRDAIYVLRPGAPPRRIRFRWESLTQREGAAASFRLQSGDVLVVE
jgi:polysaccharide biosynthesis/export protein